MTDPDDNRAREAAAKAAFLRRLAFFLVAQFAVTNLAMMVGGFMILTEQVTVSDKGIAIGMIGILSNIPASSAAATMLALNFFLGSSVGAVEGRDALNTALAKSQDTVAASAPKGG